MYFPSGVTSLAPGSKALPKMVRTLSLAGFCTEHQERNACGGFLRKGISNKNHKDGTKGGPFFPPGGLEANPGGGAVTGEGFSLVLAAHGFSALMWEGTLLSTESDKVNSAGHLLEETANPGQTVPGLVPIMSSAAQG